MSTIVAGHFQLQDQVAQARRRLAEAGFRKDQISAFYVSQPGQHSLTAIGGDNIASPGAKETPDAVAAGLAGGGAVGAALGAMTVPFTGPAGPILGALVGAHVGSLFSFSKMKDADEVEQGVPVPEPRHAGMLVAVALSSADEQGRAVALLRALGAHHIETAEGRIKEGDWTDFDPRSVPHIVA